MRAQSEAGFLGKKVFESGLWMIAWQWSARLIGFFSTIILARLLTPRDYGIVAMGMLVVSFLEILTVLGGDRYLISKSNVNEDDFNTAWTVRFIQYSLISFVLLLLSPLAANFFKEPALRSVIKVLSLATFISAFENVGIVKLKRDLEFSKIFLFGTIQKIAGFIVTVTLAFTVRNYWAMVAGVLAMRISSLALSYILVSYRPSFRLNNFRAQWSFSQWILVGNCAVYFRNKIDQLLISKIFGSNSIGLYTMASNIASLPTTELTTPAFQAVFPGLSRLTSSTSDLNRVYLSVLCALGCVIMPLSVGLASVAENAVLLLLGPKWVDAIHLVQILAIMATPVAFSMAAIDFLIINQKVKACSIIDWTTVIFSFPILIAVSTYGELHGIAFARAFLAFLFTPLYFFVIQRMVGLKVKTVLASVYRPMISVILMAIVLKSIPGSLTGLISVDLILQVALGASVYLSSLYIGWIIAGRPNSGEKLLFDKILEKIYLSSLKKSAGRPSI